MKEKVCVISITLLTNKDSIFINSKMKRRKNLVKRQKRNKRKKKKRGKRRRRMKIVKTLKKMRKMILMMRYGPVACNIDGNTLIFV